MSASTLARASATMRAMNSMTSTRRAKMRRGDACVRRARITSKEPWWDKNTAENMIDCDGVEAFLTLLVRVVDANHFPDARTPSRRARSRRDAWRGRRLHALSRSYRAGSRVRRVDDRARVNDRTRRLTMIFDAQNEHSDKLVVVDVYAKWCGACRALYPKLCKIATAYPDVVFVKLNFDDNKDLCKSLGVKVLPYFKLYRGTEGCVAQFSASIAKIKLLRAALEEHSAARCALHEGETVHYDDLDDLAEFEALTDEQRKETEPSPVA